eukprot:COSAG04_NODE_20333_length_396_cov_0.609428_2_plen_69_part_01
MKNDLHLSRSIPSLAVGAGARAPETYTWAQPHPAVHPREHAREPDARGARRGGARRGGAGNDGLGAPDL